MELQYLEAVSDAVCSFLDFACQAGAEGLVFDKDGNVNITDQAYADALQFMVDTGSGLYSVRFSFHSSHRVSGAFYKWKNGNAVKLEPSVSGSC